MDKYIYSEPCSQHLSKGVSSENVPVASAFLNNDRLNHWKPIGGTKHIDPNDNKLYCYINNHGSKDIVLQGDGEDKCNKDKLFETIQDKDFITNVFVDNNYDATSLKGTSKCVIELDKSKLRDNERNVNNFWSALGGETCKSIQSTNFAKIGEYKKNIISIKATIKTNKDILRALFDDKKTLDDLNNTFDKLNSDMANLIASFSHIETRKEKRDQLCAITSKLKQVNDDLKSKLKDYTARLNKLNADIQKFEHLRDSYKTQIEGQLKNKKQFDEEIDTLNVSIRDNISVTYKYRIEIYSIIKDIDIKTEQLSAYENDIIANQNTYDTLLQIKQLKEIFISEKKPELEELTRQKNKLYDDTMKVVDENNKLQRDISNAKIKLAAVQKRHAEWIPYPHFTCDEEQSNQMMQNNINEVEKVNEQNCLKKQEMLNTHYTTLLKTEYERKVNFVRDCKNNKLLVVPRKSFYHPVEYIYNFPGVPFPNFKSSWLSWKSKDRMKWDGKSWEKNNFLNALTPNKIIIKPYLRYTGPTRHGSLGPDVALPGWPDHQPAAWGDFYVLRFISPWFSVSTNTNINFGCEALDDDIHGWVTELSSDQESYNDVFKFYVIGLENDKPDPVFTLEKGHIYKINLVYYQHDGGTYLFWKGSGLKDVVLPLHNNNPNSLLSRFAEYQA
jgi:hypothetical protein